MNKEEIKDEETRNYLERILRGITFIANPTKLDIPGFGEVTATSMVNYHFSTIPYFRFKTESQTGEFFEEDGKYFVQYDKTVEQTK
mgnify:CR=1 FL=1